MSLKVAVVPLLALLAAAEECPNCEVDELELLQAKANEKFPDWTKILNSGRDAMKSGIGSVTTEMGDAITELNTQVKQGESMFNVTLTKFNKAANATATVSQNLTKFKGLVDQTISKFVPFYDYAVEEVTGAIKTTKTVATAMGQEELTQKLDDINHTITEKLGELEDATEALASEVAETSHDKYGDILDDVKGKLDSLASTTAGFREVFNTNVESLAEALQGPMEVAMGKQASGEIIKLKSQVQNMLVNLETFSNTVKTGLSTAADGVDTQLAEAKSKGFFGRIFGGLFR